MEVGGNSSSQIYPPPEGMGILVWLKRLVSRIWLPWDINPLMAYPHIINLLAASRRYKLVAIIPSLMDKILGKPKGPRVCLELLPWKTSSNSSSNNNKANSHNKPNNKANNHNNKANNHMVAKSRQTWPFTITH